MTIRSGGSYVVDPKTGEERLVEVTEPAPEPAAAEPDPAAATVRVPRRPAEKTRE